MEAEINKLIESMTSPFESVFHVDVNMSAQRSLKDFVYFPHPKPKDNADKWSKYQGIIFVAVCKWIGNCKWAFHVLKYMI